MKREFNESEFGDEDTPYKDIHKYLVALVGMDGAPLRSKNKLQKILFLLANDMPELGDQLGYAPDYCKPYSEIVARESDHLRDIGMLSTDSNKISLTVRGRSAERRLCSEVDGKILRMLGEYKKLLNDLTNKELLAFIYLMFPKAIEHSVEYKGIKQDTESLIMSLIKKEKISSQRGAELLKVTHTRIIKKMNEMGLQVFH